MKTRKTNAPWRRQGVVAFRLEPAYRIRQAYGKRRMMGLAYKIGLAVMVTGVIIVVFSGLLGGIFFEALMKLLTLLGAPEEREFLPSSEPEAGGQVLQFLGAIVFLCGACIISLRVIFGLLGLLVVGLLGLAGKPEVAGKLEWAAKPGWTGKLVWVAKLGLGAAALGFLIFVSGAVPEVLLEVLLYEIFLYDYGAEGTMSTLDTVSKVGNGMFWCGLVLLVLGKPIKTLLGSWINALGLGLIVIGIIGALLGWGAPFIIVAVVGVVTMIVGILRLLAA